MIRNAEEAREVIAKIEANILPGGVVTGSIEPGDFNKAKGYLAALEGPEVRALLEAAKHWSVCDMPAEIKFKCSGCIDGEKALAQYREAVKK